MEPEALLPFSQEPRW